MGRSSGTCPAAASPAAIGTSTKKVVPSPGAVCSTPIAPPISSTRPRLRASPSPDPSIPSALLSRSKGVNRRASSSEWIPSPVSVMRYRRVSPCRLVRTRIAPCGRLNLIALPSTLKNTCRSRFGSTSRVTSSAPCRSLAISMSCCLARGRTISRAWWIGTLAGTISRVMPGAPRSIQEISRTSFTRVRRCWPASRMWEEYSSWIGSRPARLRSSAKPSTALSGVRSSWLMRERNSLFVRFARSASSIACRAADSARLRALMSVEIAPRAYGTPESSKSGNLMDNHRRSGSGSVTPPICENGSSASWAVSLSRTRRSLS